MYIRAKRNILEEKASHFSLKPNLWFAWWPVRVGTFGDGRLVWLRRVYRFRTDWMGFEFTIYQDPRDYPPNVVSLKAHREGASNGPKISD